MLVALTREPDPQILLTVRSGALPTHAGQIAFPGGSLEADETPVEGALREAQEEVNLPPEAVEVLGELGDVWTPAGFHVTPVLGCIAPETLESLSLSEEVAQIIMPRVSELQQLTIAAETKTGPHGEARTLYRFPWRNFDIWGMTAGVLHELLFAEELG